MTKSVAHIFGGEAKVKMMRLFVFNPGQAFDSAEISHRTQERPQTVRKEVNNLEKAGLVKRRGYTKYSVKKKNGRTQETHKRVSGFALNQEYRYLPALAHFLIDASPISEKDILKKLNRAGHLKLVLVSGLFIHDRDSRVDLLIVGDHLKMGQLVSSIASIEAQIGREIRYAAFETADFKYRLGIYDKLIRDILDFPHHKLFNKLGLE